MRAGEQLDLGAAGSGERLRLTETTRREGLRGAGEAEPETLRDREMALCTRGATDTWPAIAMRGRDGPGRGDTERTDGEASKVTVRVMSRGDNTRTGLVAAEDRDGERRRRGCRDAELSSVTRDEESSDARRSGNRGTERRELLRGLLAALGRASGRDPIAAKMRSFRAGSPGTRRSTMRERRRASS